VAKWLFKEEPDHYSIDDLEAEGRTLWDGVTNNLARKNLRNVRNGDEIFYYHSGKVKAIVGEMRAISGPLPDPSGKDPQVVVVEVMSVRRLPRPVSLAEIKRDRDLQDWDLVRLSRLSVVPVTEEQWRRVWELSQS
jgi:predicted RNA-binding protein with PUA-like domain